MVTLGEGTLDVDDVLPTRTYRVVGLVRSSYYATSSSLGTTSLGSGSIQQVLYVPESDFSDDLPYTEGGFDRGGRCGGAGVGRGLRRACRCRQAGHRGPGARARAGARRRPARRRPGGAGRRTRRLRAREGRSRRAAGRREGGAGTTPRPPSRKASRSSPTGRRPTNLAGRSWTGRRRQPDERLSQAQAAAGRRPGSARRAEAAARCGGRDARGLVGAVGASARRGSRRAGKTGMPRPTGSTRRATSCRQT